MGDQLIERRRHRRSVLRWLNGARLRATLRQLGWALLTLLVTSVVIFSATSIKSPEELARASIGRLATEEQIQVFIEAHDLETPVYERYRQWLVKFVHGDFGLSVVTQRPVQAEILPRVKRTLILSVVSLAILLPIGIGLGVFAARRWGSRIDLSLNIGAVVISAFPEFVIGLGLTMLFSVTLGWLPVGSGTGIAFGSLGTQARAYILPVLTLVVASIPYILRVTRIAAREALLAPYTQAATLRGLPVQRVVWSHAMRNAAIPIVNAASINLVYFLGGVVVVENLFGFPGLGSALVEAVANGDTITVQAIALLMAAMFIVISVATDMIAIFFNPRLKTPAA